MGMYEAVAAGIKANVPVYLVGEPGTGKTAFGDDLALRNNGYNYFYETSKRGPEDLTGAMHPFVRKNGVTVTRHSTVEFLVDLNEEAESGKFTMITMDELSTATARQQAGVLMMVQSRRVGNFNLHPEIRFMLLGNPIESSAGGYDIAPPMANRLLWIQWTLTADTWGPGMLYGDWPTAPVLGHFTDEDITLKMKADVLPLIVGYVKNSGRLNAMPRNPSEQSGPWASPRTWEMCARLLATSQLAGFDEGTEVLLASGSVGDSNAGELLSYIQNLDLPDPEELLKNPKSFKVPARQDQTFAILGQVVAHTVQNLTDERNQAAWTILGITAKEGSVDLAAGHAKVLATAALASKKKLSDYTAHIKPFVVLLQNAGLIPK